MNGVCQVKEILNLIIVKSSQSPDRLFYKVDKAQGQGQQMALLFLISLPPPFQTAIDIS
jgi:hypothetical protein